MSRLKCQHCQATTEGVVLCKRCQTTASVSLEAITANHAALFSIGAVDRPRVRQRSGPADPTGNGVARIERSIDTETAAIETTALLGRWARVVTAARPELVAPHPDVSAMAAFLRRQLRVIATLDQAGDLLRELLACERQLNRIVSRSQGYWYAGICGGITGTGPDDWCPQDLFVTPGDRIIRCRACRTFWSVDQRRAQVIAQARDALLPVAVIARAAVSLLEGEPSQQRLEAKLRKWVERGILDDYGVRVLEGRPRRVYRLGDVIDRLTREASGLGV